MTQEKVSQKKAVLAHLKQYGRITPLEALRLYGCYRLSSVVYRLRNDGHKITTAYRAGVGKLGEAVNYAEYRIEGEKYEKTR